jgi:hypothetical protein
MRQRVFRSYAEPIREGLSRAEHWEGPDHGLILCWEKGRKLAESDPELAGRARDGELPVLVWKGGVDKKLKMEEKVGTLFYLAQLQALRGEDLDIDPNVEVELVCSRTGMKVIYTNDVKKYGNA